MKYVLDKLELKGFVKVYQKTQEGNMLLVAKSNMVVYTGREWVLPRIFAVDNTNLAVLNTQYVSWISFGDGAATSTDPFNPTAPTSNDTAISEIVIDSADTGLYQGKKVPLNVQTYGTNITYSEDINLDNKYLLAQVNCILNPTQANNQLINEAALWISESNDPTTATSFTMFSHVTFPTFKKTNLEYTINWFIHS